MEWLPHIKDKFDTEAAETIVQAGYPANADHLEELIFWSCFPNDPVCFETHPYIQQLPNTALAKPMADFLTHNIEFNQMDLVSDAFWLFINPRSEAFRTLVRAATADEATQKLFDEDQYSLAKYTELQKHYAKVDANSHRP